MEYLIGFLAFIIIAGTIGGIRSSRIAREKLIEKLKDGYGKVRDQEYTVERFNSLGFYYRSKEPGKADIDDITVNDLSLDEVFMCVNNTCSAAGEEYLYSMLRRPELNEGALTERDNIAELFDKNSEKRLKIQLILSKLGKIRSISLNEYLNRLEKAPTDSNVLHYAVFALYGLAVAFFGIGIAFSDLRVFGILFLILGVIYSMITYFKSKASKEAYYTVIMHLVGMIDLSKELDKFDDDLLKPYISAVREASGKLKSVSRGSAILTSNGGNILDIVLDYVRMLTHIDLIKFNSIIKIYRENTDSLNVLFENYGFLDSCIAIASFRKWLGDWAKPQFTSEMVLDVKDLYHPLLKDPVKNSISTSRSVLLTGSNASGKSTFIKALALNAILSQTLYTSVASYYRAPFYRILSSMALRDDLVGGESYYMVEIRSLKRIVDAVEESIPVLCFVDEVLRGTNTIERIAASSRILNDLGMRDCICFAATHDLELADILAGSFDSYHFSETVNENDVEFDYRLKPGKATSRNAIRLLEKLGYPERVTKGAKQAAAYFETNGTWNAAEVE